TEKQRMSFATGSLEPLSVQLGEVKAICDVLFQAKINALDGLRRERVSTDEAAGSQTDFLTDKSATNDMAVLTPYQLTFRCFTPELAAVLSGFSSSSNGILVRSVNVELAPEVVQEPLPTVMVPGPITVAPPPPTAAQEQVTRAAQEAAFRARYGIGGRGRLGEGRARITPQPAPPPVAVAPTAQPTPGRGGLQTVLDEKQLKVNMMLIVVKLAELPAK